VPRNQPLNYEAQDRAIKAILAMQARQRESMVASQQELRDRALAARSDDTNQHLCAEYGSLVEESNYVLAAQSAAIIVLLVPLVESIFCRAFRELEERHKTSPWDLPDHLRWTTKAKDHQRWDASYTKSRSGRALNGKTADAILELCDATGLSAFMPHELDEVLQALFVYLNGMFHEGLDWSESRLIEFSDAAKRWPTSWFSSALLNDAPCNFFITDVFISKCQQTIDESVIGMGRYVRAHVGRP
jgi:hypothetical protein